MRSFGQFIVHATIGLVLLLSIGFKIIAFGGRAYAVHWTNWGWTALSLFISTTSVQQVYTSKWMFVWLLAVYFPFRCMWWMIFIAVNVLFLTGSDLLDVMATEYELGLIVFGNDVIHVWPVVADICFLACNYSFVFTAFNWAHRRLRHPLERMLFVVYELFGGATVVFGGYAAVLVALGTNLQTVYYTLFSELIGVLGVIACGVAVNGALLAYMVADGLGENNAYTRFLEDRTKRVERDVIRENYRPPPSRSPL